jgi:hypothetical protein
MGTSQALRSGSESKGDPEMRMVSSALLAGVLALTSVGLAAAPTEAGWVDGWYTFAGTATQTRSFVDRTPAKTSLIVVLQKKAGGQVCRATVTVTSGGSVWRSQPIYKYTRTETRGYVGAIAWPNTVATKTMTVRTNGYCLFRVYAR